MYTGKTQREKRRLAEAITDDVVKILNVTKKEEVIILFTEAIHGDWFRFQLNKYKSLNGRGFNKYSYAKI